jgi:FkbM family methyltransferase
MKRNFLLKKLWFGLYELSLFCQNRFSNFAAFIERKTTHFKAEKTIPTYYFARLPAERAEFKMVLLRPGFIEDNIAKSKSWESHIAATISFFMKEDGIFLDIGSNIGYHSLYIASSFKNSLCICFEPHPDIYKQLVRNIKSNQHLDNVICHNAAVGNHSGKIEFYIPNRVAYNRGVSSVLANYDLLVKNDFDKIDVEIINLDEFLDNDTKDKIAVIKIDTQGYEYEVIAGTVDIIRKARPVIIFEFEANYHAESAEDKFNKILNQLPGYQPFLIKSGSSEVFQKFEISDVCQKNFEGDIICLPQDIYDL